MAALVVTTILDQPDRLPVTGQDALVSGEFVLDTGDYASGGFAVAASSLSADTIVRLIVGHSSILGVDAYWIKSTGKVKLFKDDIAGVSAEHAASAATAQSIPFVAVVRKAA